jgi:hypothetical protein
MIHHSMLTRQAEIAKRELAAFLHVVSELYGPEEAELSAQDWIDELELLHCPPELTPRDWRLVTVAAASRLAKRVSKPAHEQAFSALRDPVNRFTTIHHH